MSTSLTSQQINKIGNAIIYLSKGVSELNKTKILKLLFLLEEACIKKYGHPFFGVDFQLWKFGPVLKDVYIDLTENPSILHPYIKRVDYDDKLFAAIREFDDDEFSDNDIALMDSVINFAKHKTANNFVDFTHSKNSLWRKSAMKYGVLEQLESQKMNSTEFTVDFSLLFDDDPFFKERYETALENLEFNNRLKK